MRSWKKFSLASIPAEAAIFVIRCYQKTISPDHGIFFHSSSLRCRFFPSCSEYTAQSIRQYGLLKGIMVSSKRILKCNPWTTGGYDPVV